MFGRRGSGLETAWEALRACLVVIFQNRTSGQRRNPSALYELRVTRSEFAPPAVEKFGAFVPRYIRFALRSTRAVHLAETAMPTAVSTIETPQVPGSSYSLEKIAGRC